MTTGIINKLAVVVYTNQNYIPILKMALRRYFLHARELNVPVYVITNRLFEDPPYQDKITYLVADVDFGKQGQHFSEVLKKTLPQIPEEYIFWFCEDYILYEDVEKDKLLNLFNLFTTTDADMFSFASAYPVRTTPGWNPLQIKYEQYGFLPEEQFYYSPSDYMHKYSVQPCIWKKNSLLEIVTENNISLHDLDCSRINNPEKYSVLFTQYRIMDGAVEPQKFIIKYIEVIRHGVFQTKYAGAVTGPNPFYEDWIKQEIIHNKLYELSEYSGFIGNVDLFVEQNINLS